MYQNEAWHTAYLVMAASMSVGVITVLFSREPARIELPPAKNAAEWLRGALVEPFADFIGRYRWQAALILGLIAVYRISDVVMGIMANPFYVDMGLHQGRGGRRDQGLRRDHDAGGRLHRRRAVDAPGRDAHPDAGRGAERGHQPAVCLAGRRAGTT